MFDQLSVWIHKCIQPLVFKVSIINSTFQLKLCLKDKVSPKWNQWKVCVNIWGSSLVYQGILIKSDTKWRNHQNAFSSCLSTSSVNSTSSNVLRIFSTLPGIHFTFIKKGVKEKKTSAMIGLPNFSLLWSPSGMEKNIAVMVLEFFWRTWLWAHLRVS